MRTATHPPNLPSWSEIASRRSGDVRGWGSLVDILAKHQALTAGRQLPEADYVILTLISERGPGGAHQPGRAHGWRNSVPSEISNRL